MPFQVKVTLVTFLGDTNRYPCHFCHESGNEIVFDGEKYIGRLCPDVWPLIAPKVAAMHVAGPRYDEAGHYYPFWYAPLSVADPSMKKYDGLGFKNVLKTIQEPPGHMAHLLPPNAFQWPPHDGDVAKDIAVICPDVRSAALFMLEAFDLSELGFDTPYFRRQMVIMHKILAKSSLRVDAILGAFSKKENEEIYPALSQRIIDRLVDELELMKYVKVEDGNVTVTFKGEVKLKTFKAGLASEEVLALGL